MTTVRQLLNQKGRDAWSIDPNESVYQAIKQMADKNVGSLLVMEHGALVGIITERHYARCVVLQGKTSPTTPVRNIMGRAVVSVGLDETVDDCMSIMTDFRVRHLPVLQERRPIGVLSIGDLVKCIIEGQRHTIQHLEQYIHGHAALA